MVSLLQMSIYMTRNQYMNDFKPTFLETHHDPDSFGAWVKDHATVVILDFLPPENKQNLFSQDSYVEALTADRTVIREVGWDNVMAWLTSTVG
jgi:hypothetical protein